LANDGGEHGVGEGEEGRNCIEEFSRNCRGVKQLLEPGRLAEFRANVAALNNQAIFEIPEIFGKLLG
jgi:hypothetical protein